MDADDGSWDSGYVADTPVSSSRGRASASGELALARDEHPARLRSIDDLASAGDSSSKKKKPLADRVKSWCWKGALFGCTVMSIPYIILAGFYIAEMSWPKAKTEEIAYRILAEEKNRLDITDDIVLQISEDNAFSLYGVVGFIGRSPDGKGYLLGMNRKELDRIVIRHELYHIHQFGDRLDGYVAGTVDENIELIRKNPRSWHWSVKDFYTQEWQACLYAVSGITI